MKTVGWLFFCLIQLAGVLFDLLGLLVLIAPCLARAWEDCQATYAVPDAPAKNRTVDRWTWPLNAVWGNPEDGVSGAHALIWQAGVQIAYMAGRDPRWRAYCWSAGRNRSDGLKYLFACPGGPFLVTRFSVFGPRYLEAGWHPVTGLPTFNPFNSGTP